MNTRRFICETCLDRNPSKLPTKVYSPNQICSACYKAGRRAGSNPHYSSVVKPNTKTPPAVTCSKSMVLTTPIKQKAVVPLDKTPKV